MKLKNLLRLVFIGLTLTPFIIVSVLLYKSGFELSKESYTNNLAESINVQADYISQTIENGMIYDSRFAERTIKNNQTTLSQNALNEAFKGYLEVSEDKISVCIVLDKNNQPIYTMGEKKVIDHAINQLPNLQDLKNQQVSEFQLSDNVYSLGTITPVWKNNDYLGSMISIYDKSYIFKIVSNYYDITNTSTYIYRQNGENIHFKGDLAGNDTKELDQSFHNFNFQTEGDIDAKIGGKNVSGYYRSIHNTPWYLVGMIDDGLIYKFTNQFIFIYIIIISLLFVVDIALAFYFTNKVIKPIYGLIQVMDKYQNNLNNDILDTEENSGYFETNYLRKKFFELMKKIMLVQHNFQGIYQLYQSNEMNDTNIDIDVKKQTINSNKEIFEKLLSEIELKEDDCVVENFVKCFCKEDEDLLRTTFENMRDQHLAVTRELEVYTPHFDEKWFHVVVVPLYEDDRLSKLFIQLRDISGFKKHQIESSEQARRDPLTGLYNRYGLFEYVKEIMKESAEYTHGILFIDINYFKMVNDYFGHSEGDVLLCQIAKDLLALNQEKGIVSRIGGDEFIFFVPHVSKETLLALKSSVEHAIVYPYTHEDESFAISASVGMSMWKSGDSITFEELLNLADSDMYQEKRRFKAREK